MYQHDKVELIAYKAKFTSKEVDSSAQEFNASSSQFNSYFCTAFLSLFFLRSPAQFFVAPLLIQQTLRAISSLLCFVI